MRSESAPPLSDEHFLGVAVASLKRSDGEARSAADILQSEIRYRRLFEAARDGILLLDSGTRKITDSNPFMTELLGYRREELLGRELWQIGLINDEAASRSVFRELQAKSFVRYEHLPLQSKTGESHAVEFVSNLYEEDGVVVIQCNIRDITAHKETEQRLSTLDACIATLNDIVFVFADETGDDPGPRIVFVNSAFERITGYACSEAMGRSPFLLFGEKVVGSHVLDEIREALAHRAPIRRRLNTVRKDGAEICLDIDIVPVRDAAGEYTHFAATARDVTESKKAEEQLLWKTAFFEAQVHSAQDGILVVDGDGRKVLQNERLVELWQIPREFADENDDTRQLGWVAKQIRDPWQFTEKVAYLFSHPNEISQDEIELTDGRFFDRYSAPVRGKDGKHYGRIWSFRDVTARKRAEEQIAEQAAFLDKAQDAITVRSLKGDIVFWNKGAERMYGWARQEAMSHNGGDLLSTCTEKFVEANNLTIARGEWSGELEHHTKDRREIIVAARWTLIRDQEGLPKAVLAINTDITEKKKIETQFMRAQRMESIGTLAGGIAHDLNNILSPIMMAIDLLKKESDTQDTTQLLEIIKSSAQRGADIVRQVLSFTRGVEGERVEIQPKHVLNDLQRIITDTFPKDIRLEFAAPNGIRTLSGDPTQMHQVLLNLCLNARDAMPTGGRLTVSVENYAVDEYYVAMNIQAKLGPYVKISVADSGAGIPSTMIDKIFEPFFTTKDVNKGTGLGLSTAMAIIKSHGGFINVYSEPGHGTTFNVYLPAMENLSKGRIEPVPEVALPRGNGETILVVDDEAPIIAITKETLEAYGYQVLSACDGADAVAVYAQHRREIAAVLTDMMMPVMGGAATIAALTRINPTVKIVAASGLAANDKAARSASAGVKHFLTKPYSASTLLQTLQIILHEA